MQILYTVNVDIFALYIFLRHSRFLNVHENMYNVKITFIMSFSGNIVKNVNINAREIVNFRNFGKIYTRKNIYIHSIARCKNSSNVDSRTKFIDLW